MSEFDDEVLPEDGVEEEEEILSEDDEPETDPLDGIEIANDANLPDPTHRHHHPHFRRRHPLCSGIGRSDRRRSHPYNLASPSTGAGRSG